MKRISLLILLNILISIAGFGAFLKYVPQAITQPNGVTINCYASGDEFYHWVHDTQGYTIVFNQQNETYYYAIEKNGEIVASEHEVGLTDPTQLGLKPWLKISSQEYKNRVDSMMLLSGVRLKSANTTLKATEERFHEGIINNLVIFIKFKDGENLKGSLSHYTGIFNGTNSVRSFYKEVSYNKLELNSHFFPTNENNSVTLAYEDYHDRDFYRPYHSTNNTIGYKNSNESTQRRSALLKNALEYIKDEVSPTLLIDKDNNQMIDNISFVVQGQADGWSDLLWPHTSVISNFSVFINGAKANVYTFQFENTSVNTFCHEMFHMLGGPDLYHYSSDDLNPVGPWDIMANGSGHMGAYLKFQYSDSTWIENIPEIKESGRYTLYPISRSENNAYKFYAKDVLSNEYFVLEYRNNKENGLDKSLPKSGLLIYRINDKIKNGNKNGPPDEVYIYRPGGGIGLDGDVNQAAYANVEGFVLGNEAEPAYYSDGTISGIKIFNVSDALDSISFNVQLEKSSVADIESFFLMGQNTNGVINSNTGIIYCNVLASTNLAKSKPIIKTSELSTINPKSGANVDLSQPFQYKVTSENGTEKIWTIIVDSDINNKANIDSIKIRGNNLLRARINYDSKSVSLIMKQNSSIEDIAAIIYPSPGAGISPNPDDIKDYTQPVVYRVNAEDGVTYNDWSISASISTGSDSNIMDNIVAISNNTSGEIQIHKFNEQDYSLLVYNLSGSLVYKQSTLSTLNTFKLQANQVYLLKIYNHQENYVSRVFVK